MSETMDPGNRLARELRERYHVRGILILAAETGYITELRCAMPHCFAPDRGRFDPLGVPLGPWMPTREHFPLARRFKGGAADCASGPSGSPAEPRGAVAAVHIRYPDGPSADGNLANILAAAARIPTTSLFLPGERPAFVAA
jgi:hypothetical protein